MPSRAKIGDLSTRATIIAAALAVVAIMAGAGSLIQAAESASAPTATPVAKSAPRAEAQQAAGLPFSYQNPIDFSYPYNDGTRERSITELRDPAIIRVGEMYYLTYTVFPFTHSTRRDPARPDTNSPPGIMLYSSPDLKRWKFENWLIKSADLSENCPYKHRFWASEIHRINGRFYLIFTADNWIKDEYNKGGKIGVYVAFVGVSDKVTGPYEDREKLGISNKSRTLSASYRNTRKCGSVSERIARIIASYPASMILPAIGWEVAFN